MSESIRCFLCAKTIESPDKIIDGCVENCDDVTVLANHWYDCEGLIKISRHFLSIQRNVSDEIEEQRNLNLI